MNFTSYIYFLILHNLTTIGAVDELQQQALQEDRHPEGVDLLYYANEDAKADIDTNEIKNKSISGSNDDTEDEVKSSKELGVYFCRAFT